MRCLDIGPGEKAIITYEGERWESLQHPESGRYQQGDIEHDITAFPWPIADNTYDIVHMSHVLEHIPWYHTLDALREVYRITKGIAEIWVPDFAVIINAYHQKTMADNWRKYNEDDDYMLWVNGRIFTYGPRPHHAVFDEPYLRQCMARAGFKALRRLTEPRVDAHKGINLGIGGMK